MVCPFINDLAYILLEVLFKLDKGQLFILYLDSKVEVANQKGKGVFRIQNLSVGSLSYEFDDKLRAYSVVNRIVHGPLRFNS